VLVAQLQIYTKIVIYKSEISHFYNMQGKKNFAPQLFISVNFLDLVPADNFYRRLQAELDL